MCVHKNVNKATAIQNQAGRIVNKSEPIRDEKVNKSYPIKSATPLGSI